MAIEVPTSLVAALDGIRLSDYASQIEAGVDVTTFDATVFGSGSFTETGAALRGLVVNIGGMNDFSALETLLAAEFASAAVVTIAPTGETAGNVAMIGYGLVNAWRMVNGTVGAPSTIQVPMTAVGGGRPLQGLVTRATTTAVTATATTTAVNVGAAATGAWASFHVLAVSGTLPTITAQLQSSTSSGGSFTARGSASASRSAVGGDWVVGATTTDTWWRLSLTVGGTNPSFTVLAAIGVI
jgi:hypothetical protein